MSAPGVFITGIDTGVGKTFFAALLAAYLKARGVDAGVMKPVETGCMEGPDGELVPADALALMEAAGSTDALETVVPYRFREPASPTFAAREAGAAIDIGLIKDRFDTIATAHDSVIVEGAGGLLVPVSGDKTMADLAAMLDLPVVIVAASRLGAVNHTLLTVESARARSLDILAIVLNHPGPADLTDISYLYNAEEIALNTTLPVFEQPYSHTHNKTKKGSPLEEGGAFDPAASAARFISDALGL